MRNRFIQFILLIIMSPIFSWGQQKSIASTSIVDCVPTQLPLNLGPTAISTAVDSIMSHAAGSWLLVATLVDANTPKLEPKQVVEMTLDKYGRGEMFINDRLDFSFTLKLSIYDGLSRFTISERGRRFFRLHPLTRGRKPAAQGRLFFCNKKLIVSGTSSTATSFIFIRKNSS